MKDMSQLDVFTGFIGYRLVNYKVSFFPSWTRLSSTHIYSLMLFPVWLNHISNDGNSSA